ncbi:MAG: hypothetical protein U9P00_09125 [Pseudomonadota bacterium]|nr:hypothetical protein [Pseudomonadota bacterium]
MDTIDRLDRACELTADELGVTKETIYSLDRKNEKPAEMRAIICLIGVYYYDIPADTIAEYLKFKTTCKEAPRSRQVNARITKYFVECDKHPERKNRLYNILDYLGLDDEGILNAYEDRTRKYTRKNKVPIDTTHSLLNKWGRSHV